jgi:hypothetical protein
MHSCQLHHNIESWLHNSMANGVAMCLHIYEHHFTCSNTDFYINIVLLAFSNASSHVRYFIVLWVQEHL